MSRLLLCVICLGFASAASNAQLRVVSLPQAASDSGPSTGYTPAAGEPLLMSPGHYVLPSPYRADFFSPHLRPFPDYSSLRLPPTAATQSFGNYPAYPAYPGAFASPCAGGFGSAYPTYGCDVQSAYNQGRYDAQHEYLWYQASQRSGQLLTLSSTQLDEGQRLFREGKYEQALVNFLGAAEANHESAPPRLRAAHALFALGRYRQAIPLLERAFELSPLLAYRTCNIRDEYGVAGDFDAHCSALSQYVQEHPRDAAGLTLQGYIRYVTEGPGAADRVLRMALRLAPRSYFLPKLVAVSTMAAPVQQPSPARVRQQSSPKTQPAKLDQDSQGPRVVYLGRTSSY